MRGFNPLSIIAFIIMLSWQSSASSEWIISTIAGDGTYGDSGDSSLATFAQLNKPWGIAVDSRSIQYFADSNNHRIRKIDNNGIISTIAGDGTQGYHGDGGAARFAQLNQPRGIALDSHGNLYFADSQNHVIRKITSLGIITTIVGNNTPGYSGDGGLATVAKLNYPVDVAIDKADNLYIADKNNYVIRKIDTNGIITTIAGDGTRGNGRRGSDGPATRVQLSYPQAVALDSLGNLYIAEYDNHVIRKINNQGYITTIAGDATRGYSGDGGLATAAQLNFPASVAVDSVGNLYISDTQNYRIRRVDTNGIITTIAGNGIRGYSGDNSTAIAARIDVAFYVAVDKSGNLYFADTLSHRIRKLSESELEN